MTKLLLAAGAAAAVLAGPTLAGAQSGQNAGGNGATKFSLCHRTGQTVQVTPVGETTPVTANRGVVINVPANAALNHIQQHGDLPLGTQVLRSGTKCLTVGTTGNLIDEKGQLLQDAKQFIQGLINDPNLAADLKQALQDLLNKLS